MKTIIAILLSFSAMAMANPMQTCGHLKGHQQAMNDCFTKTLLARGRPAPTVAKEASLPAGWTAAQHHDAYAFLSSEPTVELSCQGQAQLCWHNPMGFDERLGKDQMVRFSAGNRQVLAEPFRFTQDRTRLCSDGNEWVHDVAKKGQYLTAVPADGAAADINVQALVNAYWQAQQFCATQPSEWVSKR